MATILVVEEEEVIRGLVRIILQNAKHNVVEAGSGDAAWQLMHRGSVDAVVVDCLGHTSDGLALIKRMRAEVTIAQIPVVAMCGLGQAGAEAGLWASALVIKPFRPANLLMKVEAVLASRTAPVQPVAIAQQVSGSLC